MTQMQTILSTTLTMTLKEITDLLGVRHNNAMRTVESMAKDPSFGGVTQIEYRTSEGNTYPTYLLNKRQSIAVAARLNTALLMRIIDRWQELENGSPKTPTTFLEAMELCVALERERVVLAGQVAEQAPVVEAHKRLTSSEGTHEIRQAAKLLKMSPKELTDWMSDAKWIYQHHKKSRWSAFQDKISDGLLMHYVEVFDLPNGGSVTSNQVRVTANGLATLAILTDNGSDEEPEDQTENGGLENSASCIFLI